MRISCITCRAVVANFTPLTVLFWVTISRGDMKKSIDKHFPPFCPWFSMVLSINSAIRFRGRGSSKCKVEID